MGEWKNDFKHGKGVETLQNGANIKTTWEYGLKNGEGLIVYKGHLTREVIYYKDLMWLENKQNPDFFDKCHRNGVCVTIIILSLITMLLKAIAPEYHNIIY